MLPSFAFSGSAVHTNPFRHLKSKSNSVSGRRRGAGVRLTWSTLHCRRLRPPHSPPSTRVLPAHSVRCPRPRAPPAAPAGRASQVHPSPAPRARHLGGRAGGRRRGGACLKGVGSQVRGVIVLGKHPLPGPAPHEPLLTHPPTLSPTHTSRSSLRLPLRDGGTLSQGSQGKRLSC